MLYNVVKHDFDNKELSSATAHKYEIVGTIRKNQDFQKWRDKNCIWRDYKGYDGFTYPIFHIWSYDECKIKNILCQK